jgi:uncharacterized protein YdhG (YjbR/CyaY superfamily)
VSTHRQTSSTTSVADVDRYLANVSDDKRPALQALRETIRTAAPKAEEGMSYGAPAFRYLGRPLVAYAAAKGHCSFFPMDPGLMDTCRDDLAPYDTAKGTIRFKPSEPLPDSLVHELVRARLAQIDASSKVSKPSKP